MHSKLLKKSVRSKFQNIFLIRLPDSEEWAKYSGMILEDNLLVICH